MIRPSLANFPNKKALILSSIAACLVIVASVMFFLYHKKGGQDDQAYARYIDAYTSGTISKNSNIRIHLAFAPQGLRTINAPEQRNLFDFSPFVKGKAYWIDGQTIEFRPDEPLEPGKKYEVTFKLDEVTQTEKGLGSFKFNFRVITPGMIFSDNGLVSENNTSLDYMKLTGEIQTADDEDKKAIEQTIETDFGQKLSIKWQHNPGKNSALFTIDSIKKAATSQQLIVKWNGKPLNAEETGSKAFRVPALGEFSILDIKAVQNDEDYALVQFSKPVNVAQDLSGLITLGDLSDLNFTIDGSQVKIYAPDALSGTYVLNVLNGIESIDGQKITQAKAATIEFENKLPAVTIAGSGTILPNAGKLVLPFDAINLKAVDVTVLKIYENNVPQFFQSNNYKDGNNLRLVAKPVLQKTISLENRKGLNLHKKNRFTLDLDQLMKTEPGAIYRITIGFRESYNIFNCKTGKIPLPDDQSDTYNYYDNQGSNDVIDEDDEFWQRYNNFYPENYQWKDKDNPCTPSFYTNDKWATRNLIASNIGIVAKKGNDNSMLIATTDLLTARPLGGVNVQLLDFQKQVIITVRTGSDGLVQLTPSRTPFLLVARHSDDRGYLKLDDAGSLPLSRFDVAGTLVQKGLKGFIYGERGVWRPGDSIFVTFILEDRLKKLPENYPVAFELYSPQGQLNKTLVNARPVNGFYTFKTATDPSAPTGNWTAKIKAGGALFTRTIKVETIMPNRLKIKFDVGNRTFLSAASPAAKLTASWLFGAPGKNLKAKTDVYLNTTETKFKGFEDFRFDNPVVNFQSQNKTIFEGTLDQNGSALISTRINQNKEAPGILRANFTTKVFEPGGNFSIDNFSIPYHVYSSYLGIKTPSGNKLTGMLLTGTDHKIEIVNVNQEGKLTNEHPQVQVELYKVQWRWWWEQEDRYSFANFTQNEYNKLISKANVTLNGGKGSWNLRINDEGWGRYLLLVRDLKGGHVTGKSLYVDYPGWARREQQNNPTEASMLSFTSDKAKYSVGQDITLTIPTANNGRALISIENGSKVLKTFWTETKPGQTQFTFKAESEMAPNVFANITLLQPHAQTINDLPIRMYGAIPIAVEDPQTILKPVINMPAVLVPESNVKLTVSEQNGKAMTYTIALVDEGLLDLTRFQTPDPHSAFYAREGLGVKTWDMFDYVLGAWGGNLERILSIGGDGTINRNINPAKANRFKPVLKYLGPFTLAGNEKKTHTIRLPQYIGAVRAMVVAGREGAYGLAEKTAQVKKPLMLLATLPRVIGPGERFTIPVSVFATEPGIKNVNVQMTGSNLTMEGSRSKVVNFKQTGEEMLYFNATAPNAAGMAKIKIVAQSGAQKAFYEVELDVRNPNPYITNSVTATLQPNQTWSTAYKPLGMQGTNTGALEVSAIPSINLEKRLQYLIQYPHGCLEQTTSAAFPQLLLKSLTPLSTQQKTTSDRNIKAGIRKIRAFQAPDGGLSYWPGEGKPDDWGTTYAGHFLVEAQNAGYTLPAGLLDELLKYQKKQAVNWTPNSNNFSGGDLSQAYRLYMLALAKKPEIAAMNRLRTFQYLSVAAKWRLAAAYQLAGQGNTANLLIRGLPTDIKPYQQLGGTYGSDLRDEAMILETLTLMGQKNKAAQLLQTIASKIGSEDWYSTQTTAYALLAIAKFCGENPSANKLNYSYTLDGKNVSVSTPEYLNTAAINFKGNKAVVVNTGKTVLFVKLVLSGQPVAGQNNFLPDNPAALRMDIAYKQLNGREIDPSKLKQGTDFYAEVTVKNPGKLGNYAQMALTQIFPSGWEIINTRLNNTEGPLAASSYTYRDIRDDRVLTYFDLRANETVTYKVLLNASYIGRYYLSAVHCAAMYNNNITATRKGKWIEVVK